MDVAYNHHNPHFRRNNCSLPHLNHLSLAPLNIRMPLSDPESLTTINQYTSFKDGHFTAINPSKISHCLSRSSTGKLPRTSFPKSKSSTYLTTSKKTQTDIVNFDNDRSWWTFPNDKFSKECLSDEERNESDWLLRTGAILASSARESKGQAWLASRASSVNVVKLQDDYKVWKKEYEWDTVNVNWRCSNRDNLAGDSDHGSTSPSISTSSSLILRDGNQAVNRQASRVVSRCGSKTQLSNPSLMELDDHFEYQNQIPENYLTVESESSDLKLIYEGKKEYEDEATIRKLASDFGQGLGGWIEGMLGWKLNSNSEIEETEKIPEDFDVEGDNDEDKNQGLGRPFSQIIDLATYAVKVDVPPPKEGEISIWQDAAWILSIATRVLF